MWGKPVLVKLPEGMPAQIDALLAPTEARTDFIRQAIEREIKRRSRLRD
jgi:metal-responsive CopG/Arc/MetJ family transcriptional regulator